MEDSEADLLDPANKLSILDWHTFNIDTMRSK